MTDMKNFRHHGQPAGFTLVELLFYLGISVLVSAVIYSFLTGATTLYAKNMSIVHSHTHLRSVLDRLTNNLQQAYTMPVLMDTGGNTSAAPAAGLYYDRFVGAPYLVNNSSGTGLASTTTSVTITASTAALASPPAPKAGDALLISDPNGDVRCRISAVSTGVFDAANQRQPYTLTFAAALGKTITWSSPEVRVASLLHREAFLVVPGTASAEFRFYPNFETVTAMNDATGYTVVSNQLSILAGETTPFSIDTVGSDRIVRASLFARSTEYSTWLANKQANEFNTFVRLNALLASRLRPR